MTKLVLPRMLEKRKGVIVNLSSCVSGIMPPMLAGYAATKVTELWFNPQKNLKTC
jgi:short-subunit dehydrogenase